MTLCDDFYKDRTFQKSKPFDSAHILCEIHTTVAVGGGERLEGGDGNGSSYMNSLTEFNSKVWYSSGIMYVKKGLCGDPARGSLREHL